MPQTHIQRFFAALATFTIVFAITACVFPQVAFEHVSGGSSIPFVLPKPRTAPVLNSSDPEGDEWPMFRGQLNHTGVATTLPLYGTEPIWSYNTTIGLESSPVVSGGLVFMQDNDQKIYCLNATTGTSVWNATVPCASIFSSPAVADGRIFVGGSDNKIYCLDASTGDQIWNFTAGGKFYSSPAVSGGRVYEGSYLDGKFYCLNETTGAQIWNVTLAGPILSSAAVAGGRVYVGGGKNITCLDATSGAGVWNYTMPNDITPSPAVANGRVYACGGKNVTCLDASSGTWYWNYSTGNSIYSSPAVAGGYVYVGSTDLTVYALDATTGVKFWSYATSGQITSSPAVANGSVFIGIGSTDKRLLCLNASSGAVQWSYLTGNAIYYSSPAIANGSVFVASLDDVIYRLPMKMLPTAPQKLRATAGNGQVNLTWQAPAIIGGIVNYTIYRSIMPGGETYLATVGNVLTFTDGSITDGQIYYYKITATNGAGEGLQSIEVHTPIVTVINPNAGTLFGVTGPVFNVTVFEPDLSTAWYRVGISQTNNSFTNGTSTPVEATDWAAQPNGTVILQFWANDTLGDVGIANVTVHKDIIAPSITGTGLVQWQLCNETAPAFSLTISEANLNTTWYSLDNGVTNTTCSLTGTLATQWASYGNGTVTVTFWANDTLGNVSTTSVFLLKDIIAPSITGTGLAPWQLCNATAPAFILTISEASLNTTWYSLDNGVTNTTCSLTGTLAAQWASYGNGTVTVTFWANDTLGNVGTASVTVYKDIIAPSITGTGLAPWQLCNATPPAFSLTIGEANFNMTWYSLDGGLTNTTCSLMGMLATQWASYGNGTVTVTFWANDTLGNVGTASVTVYKDIIAPSITGTGLVQWQLCNETAPAFSLTITEANLNTTWYSLDNGVTNTTCSLTGTLAAQWASYVNGTVTVTFWANDTLGNVSTTSVTILKDIIAPSITGTGLALWQLCNATTPPFTLTITEANLNTIWYSLDGGLTNTTCGLTGNFAVQWGGRINGTVTVTFWANDSVGNEGTATIVIEKDASAPTITITNPINGQTYTNSPQLTFTTSDANLDKVWYTIGTNTTKFFLSSTSAEIDVQAWGALPAGNVIITLHANDTLGNEASSPVTIMKQTQEGLLWLWVIIIVIAAIAMGLITIPRLLKKKSANKRRFVSTPLLAPPATVPDKGAEIATVTDKKLVIGLPKTTVKPSAVAIPLGQIGEDEMAMTAKGEHGVIAFRGGQIVGPRFIYKVKVKNATDTTITDVGIQLVSYPRECMRLVTDEVRHVPKIEPGGFRSLEFELQPQKDCVEGALISSVNYLDSRNELFTLHVKPFILKSVCDLMEPLVIPETAFDELVRQWASTQEVVTFKGEDAIALAEDVPTVIAGKNFHPIAHHLQKEGGTLKSITKGIATGKYTKRRLALIIRIDANVEAGDGLITCTGYAEDESMLVACLGELLVEFRKPLVRQVRRFLRERKGLANIEELQAALKVEPTTLADAVRQEPDILFLRGGEQVATYSFLVDFLNAMRKKYDTLPVSELEAELKPVNKTMQGILQELIAAGKLRAVWIGAEEIRFKTEMHKVVLKLFYYIVAFISGLVTIILFLMNFLK